jgi:hypothetical protein
MRSPVPNTRAAFATTIALVLALGVAGCSMGAEDVATPTPIAGDTDGDGKVSGFEQEALAKTQPIEYVLPDGTTALIDQSAPLPPEVVDAIKSSLAGGAAELTQLVADGNGQARIDALRVILNDASAATGRALVVVLQDGGRERITVAEPWNNTWGTIASGKVRPDVQEIDRDTAIAGAEAWAKGHEAEVIVLG